MIDLIVTSSVDMEDSSGVGQEVINKRALRIVKRVRDKLTGDYVTSDDVIN